MSGADLLRPVPEIRISSGNRTLDDVSPLRRRDRARRRFHLFLPRCCPRASAIWKCEFSSRFLLRFDLGRLGFRLLDISRLSMDQEGIEPSYADFQSATLTTLATDPFSLPEGRSSPPCRRAGHRRT